MTGRLFFGSSTLRVPSYSVPFQSALVMVYGTCGAALVRGAGRPAGSVLSAPRWVRTVMVKASTAATEAAVASTGQGERRWVVSASRPGPCSLAATVAALVSR